MSFYHQLPWCDLTTVTGLRQDTRVRSANTQSSAEASLYVLSTYKGAAPRPCPRPHAHARTGITGLIAPQCVPQPRQHLICGGKARRGGCRASCRIETSEEGRQGKRKGEAELSDVLSDSLVTWPIGSSSPSSNTHLDGSYRWAFGISNPTISGLKGLKREGRL